MATSLEASRGDLAKQIAVDVLDADHVKVNENKFKEIGRTFICKPHILFWCNPIVETCVNS
jgi:hypothetical protein